MPPIDDQTAASPAVAPIAVPDFLAPAPAPLLWARGGIGGCGGGATRAAEPPRGLASEPARGHRVVF